MFFQNINSIQATEEFFEDSLADEKYKDSIG